MHLFPCLSGLTGCGCLGIIIIISDRQFEPKLEPWLCTPDSWAIFSFRLYLRVRGKTGGEGETRGSPGAYLSLKSHLRALSLLFLKGASIAMPNLAKVLIKGLLYCYSLHNCVRCLWKLMAQQSSAILVRLCSLSAELVFTSILFSWNLYFQPHFVCCHRTVNMRAKVNNFTVRLYGLV